MIGKKIRQIFQVGKKYASKALSIGKKIYHNPITQNILQKLPQPVKTGINMVRQGINFVRNSRDNFNIIKQIVQKNKIDLLVVGPEKPLVDGIVDYLTLGNSSIFNHSGNYSISVWIKKIGQPDGNRDTNDNPTIIAKGNVYFTLFVNYDGMLGTFFYNNSNN